MDVTIRNMDEGVYRRLKAWAASEGLTVGEAVAAMVNLHAAGPIKKRRSLMEMPTWDFGPGNERLSEEIDDVLYGKPHGRP